MKVRLKVSEGEGESEGSEHTLSLDLQSGKAGHPHAFLNRRRIESDGPELLGRFFRVAEVQFHQILRHSKARQPPCQTRPSSIPLPDTQKAEFCNKLFPTLRRVQ